MTPILGIMASSKLQANKTTTVEYLVIAGGGGGNTVININGVIDAESARRSIEKLLQNSARRTGPINLVGATL